MIEIREEQYAAIFNILKISNESMNDHFNLVKHVFEDAREIARLKEEVGNLQTALKGAYAIIDAAGLPSDPNGFKGRVK